MSKITLIIPQQSNCISHANSAAIDPGFFLSMLIASGLIGILPLSVYYFAANYPAAILL